MRKTRDAAPTHFCNQTPMIVAEVKYRTDSNAVELHYVKGSATPLFVHQHKLSLVFRQAGTVATVMVIIALMVAVIAVRALTWLALPTFIFLVLFNKVRPLSGAACDLHLMPLHSVLSILAANSIMFTTTAV